MVAAEYRFGSGLGTGAIAGRHGSARVKAVPSAAAAAPIQPAFRSPRRWPGAPSRSASASAICYPENGALRSRTPVAS